MSTWKYIVVGADSDKGEPTAVVMSATGAGKKETLECVGKKSKEKQPDSKFEVGEEDGRTVVSLKDDTKLYALSDDVIAVITKDQQEAFKGLVDGKGTSALDGSLKEVFASVDQSKHIYFGLTAPKDMQEGPTAGMKHLTGTFDLSKGLAIAVAGEFGDEAKAKELATMANTEFDKVKGMAGMVGVPPTVVATVKIEAKGGAVAVSAAATNDELKQISDGLKKMMGGAGGPGGAPGGAAAPH
jgi:hypothetical protein